MTQSKFRNKISLSAKGNGALKDILSPTSIGVEVESIEAIIAPLHNTKAVIRTDLRKTGQTVTDSNRYSRRVITYNRVDINTILPEGYTPSSTVIATEVEKLNSLHSCDFTEDDILIEGGKIVANPNSLGYRNATVVSPPAGSGQKMDKLKFDAFLQTAPAGKLWLAFENTSEIIVVVNGVANTKTVTWNPTLTPHVSLILELIEWVKECASVDFDLNRVLNYIGRVSEYGLNEAYPVSGGNFTIKNLGSTPVDIGISIKYKNINNSYFEHITVLPYMRLAAIGSTKTFADNLPHILKIDLPPSQFYENGLIEEDDVDYTKFKVNGLTVGLFDDANRLFVNHADEYGQYSTFDSALWNFCKNNLIFTNRCGWRDKDGFYRCFIENISEQPLTVEVAGVEYQLGANPLKQQNNIFRKFINTNEMPVDVGRIIGASVTLNGTEYTVEQTNAPEDIEWDFGSAIDELIKANPVINTLVDLQMGYIPYRGIVELYIENKAVLPTVISVSIKDQDDGFVEFLSPVTIAEAGSVGTPWNREELYTPKIDYMGDNVNPSTVPIMVNGVLYPIQTDHTYEFSEYTKGIRRTPDNLYIYEWAMGLVMSSPQQVGVGQTFPPSLFPPYLYVAVSS